MVGAGRCPARAQHPALGTGGRGWGSRAARPVCFNRSPARGRGREHPGPDPAPMAPGRARGRALLPAG